jgi:hypothetical protein
MKKKFNPPHRPKEGRLPAMTTWMHYRVSTGTGKSRLALLTRAALLMGLGLTMLLTACSAIAPDAPPIADPRGHRDSHAQASRDGIPHPTPGHA